MPGSPSRVVESGYPQADKDYILCCARGLISRDYKSYFAYVVMVVLRVDRLTLSLLFVSFLMCSRLTSLVFPLSRRLSFLFT